MSTLSISECSLASTQEEVLDTDVDATTALSIITTDEDGSIVENPRRDSTPHSVMHEFSSKLHEILHERVSKREQVNDYTQEVVDEDKDEDNVSIEGDSEESGVETAIEINGKIVPLSPRTPRRPESSFRSSNGHTSYRPISRPNPSVNVTPRPTRMRMPLSGIPPPPPFFNSHLPHRQAVFGGFGQGLGGPLTFNSSMRPFSSFIPPLGPLPPHLSTSMARSFHHPPPPPPPYMNASSRINTSTTTSNNHRRTQFVPLRKEAVSTPRSSSSSTPKTNPATLSSSSSPFSPIERVERPFRNLPQNSLTSTSTIGPSAVSTIVPSTQLTPYPLVYVSPAGSISCVLNYDIVVEMAVDRSVRVVYHDHFAAVCNARGTASAILHPTGRILHTEDHVYCKFIANNEKMAVFGSEGVLFTMSHLSEAYLVNSSAYPGASAVALDQLQFPSMDDDYTIKMFYTEAQTGQQFIALCKDIVSEATYDRRPDGSLYLHINGMLIRQSTTGDVIVDARPRQINCSPTAKTIHIRSGCIDMAIESDERGYVKRAHKRVHVSRSGMVISDGNCITSMDHFGRIVCCN